MPPRFVARGVPLLLGALAGVCAACSALEGLNDLAKVDCVSECLSDGGGAEASDDAFAASDASPPPAADGETSDDTGSPPSADTGADATSEAGTIPDSGDGGVDASASPAYLGCFADSQTRDLAFQAYDDSSNTPTVCAVTCASDGFSFAAVQNGTQCFCGNAYGGQGPSDGCVVPCSGDASIVCGGQYANGIYAAKPGATAPPVFEGCYEDNTLRDLPYSAYSSSFNTVAACVAACTYHGYLYAGLQFAEQCFCGDAYGLYGASSSCIDACSGDPSEICGGVGTNSVYRTSVADAGATLADGG